MSTKRQRAPSYRSYSSYSSGYSEASYQSQSTAPTVYSDRQYGTPTSKHGEVATGTSGFNVEGFFDDRDADPRSSVETYASTIPSDEDLQQVPDYESPPDRPEIFPSTATASTPPEFAELFPSTRRLHIRHDDSTVDGNMNLCINTHVSNGKHRPKIVTLYHLKMNDLHDRQFSLRRYCRTSGREVCNSRRKYDRPSTPRRPGIQRSLTSALQTMRIKPAALKRANTAGILNDPEETEAFDNFLKSSESASRPKVPTNVLQLEFSNYAHVDVSRQGTKSLKKYDFEYWGVKYQWKREIRKVGESREVSYHLTNMANSTVIAHIIPEPLTRKEALEEQYKGGWISPCSLRVSDKSLVQKSPDLAE
ncbi:MAG: hypothetical protein Q9227_007884 [Pyrenula ochraceoflavens]